MISPPMWAKSNGQSGPRRNYELIAVAFGAFATVAEGEPAVYTGSPPSSPGTSNRIAAINRLATRGQRPTPNR
jgi:hypothetical protein